MAYQINELETGMFEVVRCEPVVVGILNDRGVAELFADFLDTLHSLDRETLSAFVPDAPAAEPEPVAEPAEVTDLAPAETPSPEAEPEAPAVEAPLMPSETPLEEALRRLEAGEKLGAVADDLRLPMTMLRGTWAKWCRDNRTPGGGRCSVRRSTAASATAVSRSRSAPIRFAPAAPGIWATMPDVIQMRGGGMVTPYLKGNVAGECPACTGTGRLISPDQSSAVCRRCKGRGIVGKPVHQIIAETLAEAEQPRPGNPEFIISQKGSRP